MSWSIVIKFLILILISKSNCFEILFDDDFNDLDENKWEIISSEIECKKLFIGQKSCFKNNTKNLRTISGALVLTAIQESFANHSFTSAAVITKKSFKLTRTKFYVEMRAAFPSKQFLVGQLLFIPVDELINKTNDGVVFGIKNLWINQRQIVACFYSWSFNLHDIDYFFPSPKLNQFLIFHLVIEDRKSIKASWSLNGTILKESNYIENTCDREFCGQLIEKAKFRLALILAVQDLNSPSNLSLNDSCSSMLIDYIKVFYIEQSNFPKQIDRKFNEKHVSEICDLILNDPILVDENNHVGSKLNSTVIIVIFINIFLVFILILIIYGIFWMKRKAKINENVEITEIYDDNLERSDSIHIYDEISCEANEYLQITE